MTETLTGQVLALADRVVGGGSGGGPLPPAFADAEAGEQSAPASDGRRPYRSQNSIRPKRIVILAGWIILIGGLIYALNIFFTFLLKLADNERFIAQVMATLQHCDSFQQCALASNVSLTEMMKPAEEGAGGGGGEGNLTRG
jgi:hypothetical protein